MVVFGIMKFVGIVIIYSIFQGGFGFFVFSLFVYYYLVIGDFDVVVQKIFVNDCIVFIKYFIDQVSIFLVSYIFWFLV